MKAILALHDILFTAVERLFAAWLVPTAARLVFAGVLLNYFWSSAMTKVGPGLLGVLHPTDGAYIQIFPRAFEAVGYDSSQLGTFHWLVAIAGTSAELVLPVLIVVGLATRLASLGMIGFVALQSIVDVIGHGVAGKDLGAWFDSASNALIFDQRAFWMLLLLILVLRGAGPLSLDAVVRLFRR